MSILFIPIGLPGCGKSTLAKGLGARVISTDKIRQMLTGDENNQDRNSDVFKQFHNWIYAYLSNGHNVFADATNLTVGARQDLMKTVVDVRKIQPVETHVILFRNPLQALTRNRQRERRVPQDVMLKMLDKYEQTLTDIKFESYDFVTEVSAVR